MDRASHPLDPTPPGVRPATGAEGSRIEPDWPLQVEGAAQAPEHLAESGATWAEAAHATSEGPAAAPGEPDTRWCPQQLNLLGPAAPRGWRQGGLDPRSWSLPQAALALLLLAGLMLIGAGVLDLLALRVHGEALRSLAGADQARGQLAQAQQQARGNELAALDAERARLRRQLTEADRVRALVASGQAGQPQGHAALLLALARQANPAEPAVWITGLQVSADGQQLELRGRLHEPAALPRYLGRLHREPLFAGRDFSQLQMRRVDAAAHAAAAAEGQEAAAGGERAPAIEFTLRSGPATRPAAAAGAGWSPLPSVNAPTQVTTQTATQTATQAPVPATVPAPAHGPVQTPAGGRP